MNEPMGPRSGSRRRTGTASLLVAALLAALLALVPGVNPAGAQGTVKKQGTLGDGYFFVATDGGIFNYGDSEFKGSTGDIPLNKPIVGAASTPTGEGYYLVASDGGIFTFGDAVFYGSQGGSPLNSPIVAMAVTNTGRGYWLFAADGGVFTHGDARFFGSEGARTLNKPIVGADVTPNGLGYYLVASDGGIFTHGDAVFYGSQGGSPLNKPIVGMAVTRDGNGYYLVATDGGIFTHGKTSGDAPFFGSEGARTLNQPIVGMDLTASNQGYYLVAADGGIFTHGDAEFLGSAGAIKLNKPIVGMSVTPNSPVTAPDFRVDLRGSKEVGSAGDPDGNGLALVDFTDDEVCYNLKVNSIGQATMAHIHRGVAGVNGPVVVTLETPDNNGTAEACQDVDKALAAEILANPHGFYVNVHNAEFPGGAVRGQLRGHTAVGITGTTGTTASIVLIDTERPEAATVLRTFDTQGAPIVGVDFRPGTTDAYLLLIVGSVPTSNVDPTPTALVMQLVKSTIAGETTSIGTPFQMRPATSFGFDFNPTVDRIRVISDAGENLRLNQTVAADASPVVDSDPNTGGVQRDGDIPPGFGTAAYTNNVPMATTTSLFEINYGNDTLFQHTTPNGSTVAPIGALGVNVSSAFGFDVSPGTVGTALAAGQLQGSTQSTLLAIDLATGKATTIGRIGTDATNGIQGFSILF